MAEWGASSGFSGDAITDNQAHGFNTGGDHVGDTEHHDTTSGTAEHESSDAPAEVDNSAFEAQVKEAGWRSKVPIDYEILKQAGGDYAEWHAVSGVYEWKEEFGEVGPEVPQLEVQLYGGEHRMRQGTHIANLQFEVNVDGPNQYKPARSFQEAGLHPVILENVIAKMNYDNPTPIQAYTIPAVLADHDVLAIAQTGSGKTAAYFIPVISKLCGKVKKLAGPRADIFQPGYNPRVHRVTAQPLVIVVVPTRELAMQVFDEARRLCYRTMMRPCVVYGGLPMGVSFDELGKGCDILIGTPGRLCDLMDKPNVLSLSRIKYTIIDEADELLHDDWTDELTKIMSGGDNSDNADSKYLMFSATFPAEIRKLAREYLDQDHYRLRVGRVGSTTKNIKQDIIFVERNAKQQALFDLLIESPPCRTLVFCNSKIAVDLLDDFLYNRGLPTTSIHSDRPQREREDAIRSFRSGRTPILVATGVTARGMDIAGIDHVINYDLPSLMHGGIDEYTHRIGRTARIGNQGRATSFYNEHDEDMGQALVNVLVENGSEIPDFLSHLQPEDVAAPIEWDDESVNSDDDDQDDGGKGEEGGFTADGTEAATQGFTADTGAGGFTAEGSDGAWN